MKISRSEPRTRNRTREKRLCGVGKKSKLLTKRVETRKNMAGDVE